MTQIPALQVSGLEFSIGGHQIVRVERLDIVQKTIVVILGPSGCGKTSFLLLLCGLLPINGLAQVRILGHSISDSVRSGQINISFQTPVLMPWRTALSNVGLGLELRGQSTNDSALRKALDRVDLHESAQNLYPEALSSGMRSRVAVAQAITSHSKILLMDEVFGTLDEATRVKMDIMLREINETEMRATILFVTHSLDEALLLGDRIIIFRKLRDSVSSNVRLDVPVYFPSRTRRTRYSKEFLRQKEEIESIFFEEELE